MRHTTEGARKGIEVPVVRNDVDARGHAQVKWQQQKFCKNQNYVLLQNVILGFALPSAMWLFRGNRGTHRTFLFLRKISVGTASSCDDQTLVTKESNGNRSFDRGRVDRRCPFTFFRRTSPAVQNENAREPTWSVQVGS